MTLSRYLPDVPFVGSGDGPTHERSAYYFRQVDHTSTLWWLRESLDGRSVNVFSGRLHQVGAEDRWQGEYLSLPKGLTCDHGTVGWRVAASDRPLERVVGTGYP